MNYDKQNMDIDIPWDKKGGGSTWSPDSEVYTGPGERWPYICARVDRQTDSAHPPRSYVEKKLLCAVSNRAGYTSQTGLPKSLFIIF